MGVTPVKLGEVERRKKAKAKRRSRTPTECGRGDMAKIYSGAGKNAGTGAGTGGGIATRRLAGGLIGAIQSPTGSRCRGAGDVASGDPRSRRQTLRGKRYRAPTKRNYGEGVQR